MGIVKTKIKSGDFCKFTSQKINTLNYYFYLFQSTEIFIQSGAYYAYSI